MKGLDNYFMRQLKRHDEQREPEPEEDYEPDYEEMAEERDAYLLSNYRHI